MPLNHWWPESRGDKSDCPGHRQCSISARPYYVHPTHPCARGLLSSTGPFGWSAVYGTHFFVDPVEQVVAVMMVQTANQEVTRDFEDLVEQAVVEQ
jgi:CubicO group peptidase (beta-lactamase class C family)